MYSRSAAAAISQGKTGILGFSTPQKQTSKSSGSDTHNMLLMQCDMYENSTTVTQLENDGHQIVDHGFHIPATTDDKGIQDSRTSGITCGRRL